MLPSWHDLADYEVYIEVIRTKCTTDINRVDTTPSCLRVLEELPEVIM